MDQSGTSSHWFAVFGRQWAIFGTFADQACSSPTFATPKRPTLGRESPQTRKPPTHLATSAWQGIMGPCNAQCRALGLAPKFGVLGTLHIPQQFPPFAPPCGSGTPCPGTKNKWQNQPKCCATTLWGGNLAVVWGSGSQHGRFERYDKIGKMPLKKKTLDLATNSQKMRKIEKGQKCCATRVCLHMVKQRWANQHAHLQHTRYDNQNVQFWAT